MTQHLNQIKETASISRLFIFYSPFSFFNLSFKVQQFKRKAINILYLNTNIQIGTLPKVRVEIYSG